MPSIDLEKTTFVAGGKEYDWTQLPASTVAAMLSRGATHYFGSEVSSRAKGRADKAAKGSGNALADDEIAAIKAETLADFHEKFTSGNVGVRAVGVTVDPVEKRMEKIAKGEVLEILSGLNIKRPKKDEAVKFANGVEKTLDDMVATRLEQHGDRIRKEAEKALRDEAKKREAIAGEISAESPEAAGL